MVLISDLEFSSVRWNCTRYIIISCYFLISEVLGICFVFPFLFLPPGTGWQLAEFPSILRWKLMMVGQPWHLEHAEPWRPELPAHTAPDCHVTEKNNPVIQATVFSGVSYGSFVCILICFQIETLFCGIKTLLFQVCTWKIVFQLHYVLGYNLKIGYGKHWNSIPIMS